MQYLKYILVGLALIGFVVLGVSNLRESNQKLQLNELELKSKETKLIELNQRYDEVLEIKTKTQKEKEQQLQQIKELEQERQRLEQELQAKLQRQEAEQQRLASASKRATATATASAGSMASANCTELRARLASLGLAGTELNAAITLATRESSCRTNAVNASSGACGEFQSYPCGKWGSPGTEQYLRNAINYAVSRYGSYQAALAHSYAHNWY